MELIQHNKPTLMEALETRCIHIVFCNKDEAGCVAQVSFLGRHLADSLDLGLVST